MIASESSPRSELLRASAGFGLAVALALGGAHWYEPPQVAGAASHSLWSGVDFMCSMASGVVALAVGILFGRAATRMGATAAGSLASRVAIWGALTLLSFALWVHHLFLFTLLVAPTHGFAELRLLGLWRRWRADVTWQRRHY